MQHRQFAALVEHPSACCLSTHWHYAPRTTTASPQQCAETRSSVDQKQFIGSDQTGITGREISQHPSSYKRPLAFIGINANYIAAVFLAAQNPTHQQVSIAYRYASAHCNMELGD
jgi:hypothetical protein